MNKKIIYLISVITFLLILTISYFIPLSLSGLVNNSNQVSMVWNDIGVRNGMTYMDCVEYQSLTTDQNKAIISLLDEYTYKITFRTLLPDDSMPDYYALNIYFSNETSMNSYIFVSSSGEILIHGKTYHMKNAKQFIEQVLEVVN